MKKWSLRLSLAGTILASAALIFACGNSVDAGGKGAVSHAHLDNAIKKLRAAETALYAAGAKESKQLTQEPGVISAINAALWHTQHAIRRATQARNLDGNVK